MLKKIIMAMLVMGIASAVMAQNHYMLTGQLSDSKGQPLPYTNCVLLNAADSSFACGTTRDLDGVFSLANIKQGHYLLRVSAIGYDTHWQTIEMDKDTSLGTIIVESNATVLNEIKVTASRPLYSANGEKVFYNVSDDPSVQSGNDTDALQNAPGVEVDAESNTVAEPK